METECKLCGFLQVTDRPQVRNCIDPKCKHKIFLASLNDLYLYYKRFFDLVFTEEYYQKILFSIRFKHNLEFLKAWTEITEELVALRSSDSLKILSDIYRKKIKKNDVSISLERLSKKIFPETDHPCCICLHNPDDFGDFLFCCRCGNMICSFCKSRLKTRICPKCRYSSSSELEKLHRLDLIVKKRTGRVVKYAKLMTATVYLKFGMLHETKKICKNLLRDSFVKAIVVMAKVYLAQQEYSKSLDMLFRGEKLCDICSIRELSRIDRPRSRKYDLMALELGDYTVLKRL